MSYPQLGSRYKFIKKLGEGGVGVVNLAIDSHSGFPVAVKTLTSSYEDTSPILRKFKIEANIYLGINHPNIVQLKAPGLIIKKKSNKINQIHLVMEYVDGLTLDNYVHNITGPIPLEIVVPLFKQIVSAIGFAHDKKIPIEGYKGVLHLDIKPNNIFILGNGTVKVIDYGISQGAEEERGEVMGTLMYMAPEQYDKRYILDKRTDIYALGCLLHFMVTGANPFTANSQEDLAYKARYEKTRRIKKIYPAADGKFQYLIDKATQKYPDDRFQTCNEIITYLDAML